MAGKNSVKSHAIHNILLGFTTCGHKTEDKKTQIISLGKKTGQTAAAAAVPAAASTVHKFN